MKKRILALLLVLAMGLSLAACSVPAAENSNNPNYGGVTDPSYPTGEPSASAEPTPSTEPAIEADLSMDVLSFASETLAGAENVLTVNGEAIPASLFAYWLAFSCSYFESMYYYYGYTVKDFASYIMNDACSMAAYYALLDQKATELGCPLTDDQLNAIHEEMDTDGEEHANRQTMYGLTHEDLMFIYSVSDLYDNVQKVVVPSVTVEDLNNYVYHVKHILVSTKDDAGADLEGEALEEKTALANDILAQLQACATQEELESLFDELMNEYSEDGRDAEGNLGAPNGYTAVPGDMVAEFENASFALKPGELSGLVKSTYGYHIILRGEVEDIESYSEDCAGYMMDEVVNTWMSEAEIVPGEVLNNVDVAEFYARYVAWQSAFIAENETAE